MSVDIYRQISNKFADTRAHVLLYDATRAADLPILVGTWVGENPRADTESVGPLLRQGLAGFPRDAAWMDLAEQLEHSGFQRADDARDVLRDAGDVVRVIFWGDGVVSCQWMTLGPDDNARSAGRPEGIIPPRRRS